MITQKRLKELLHYNPDTGEFTRKVPVGKRFHAGDAVGSAHSGGYIKAMIDKKTYYLHRLAWLYVYGEMPKRQIDHVNGDRSDNRIKNLRDVPQSENSKNIKKPKTNTSGFLGVYWNKQKNKWTASIRVNNKNTHLGYYDTLIDAVIVRIKANQFYKFHENHGR